MKPPDFEYVAPRSVDEALSSLAEYGETARVLAGGQSLVPLLNMRLAGPDVLVDINNLDELSSLIAWDGGVAIGALVRQSALEHDPVARQRAPLLIEATALPAASVLIATGEGGGGGGNASVWAAASAVVPATSSPVSANGFASPSANPGSPRRTARS